MVSSFTNDTDNQYIAGLLDPLVARHYLIILNIDCCRNTNLIPFEGVLVYNRLLWLGIAPLVMVSMYRYFHLLQSALTLKK
jgi:ABC-2 type transport system permease protein